ncbi:MAG TPA: hypothetical protein VIS73_02500 [Rhodocyclaceae bacterium]
MIHACTANTDLDELIGRETHDGPQRQFAYGPLAMAMKQDEELVLENSAALSLFMRAKLGALINDLFIGDTAETLHAGTGFRVVLR